MNLIMSLKSRSGVLKGNFVKNVSTVMSGTVIAQLVTVLASPVLTRLYPAEAMGVFSLFSSIAGILSVAAAFRYELAIVLPREEKEAGELLVLASLAVAATAAASFAAAVTVGPAAAEAMGVPELKPWLAWIPCTVLAAGLYQNLNYWCTRHGRFKRVSVSQVFRSGVVSLVQLASGLLGFGAAGLIAGFFAGQSVSAAALGVQNGKELIARFKAKTDWRSLKRLARQYAEFPKYSTPQTLLNSLSQNLPVFMLAIFYGTETVAFYAVSYRLMQMPVTLISQSVRQVFLQQASAVRHEGARPIRMFRKLTLSLALLAALPTLLVVAFGPALFGAVLGTEWREAGQYARWMALWLFFAFINPPAMVMSTVYGLQRMLLAYEILLLAFRFGALYFGGLLLPPVVCVLLYSAVGALFNLYLILHVRGAALKRVRTLAVSGG